MRSLIGMGVAAALALLVAAAGCAKGHADAAVPAPRVLAAPAPGVVKVFRTAAPETIWLSREPPPPEPTAEYPSLEVVRDTVLAMVRRAAAPGDTAVHVGCGPTMFKYLYFPDSASAYAVHVVVTDTSSCLDSEVAKALESAGWVPSYGYSADGPDGTVMGFVTKDYLCVIEGHWDGGDDSDSTYVPAPGCEMTVTCVARRQEDVPKY